MHGDGLVAVRFADALEFASDGVDGLVPADLLPTRILVEALLGIRALQRLGDAVGS